MTIVILAHAVSAILYVAVGWWAGRDGAPFPLVMAATAFAIGAVALGVLVVCGGAL